MQEFYRLYMDKRLKIILFIKEKSSPYAGEPGVFFSILPILILKAMYSIAAAKTQAATSAKQMR